MKSQQTISLQNSMSHSNVSKNNIMFGVKQEKNSYLGSKQLEEIVQSLKTYLKSAIDLKNNLSIGIQNNNCQQKKNIDNYSGSIQSLIEGKTHLQSKAKSRLGLVITKVEFFIENCKSQLKKINKVIQSVSASQIPNLGVNFEKVLIYIKQKYSQLIKQAYRTLNIEGQNVNQSLSDQDKQLIGKSRINKLHQINQIQKQMNFLWQNHDNNVNLNLSSNENPIKNTRIQSNSIQNEQYGQSVIVSLQNEKSNTTKNVEVLSFEVGNIDLRAMAKQELEKEFIQIRLQAYAMYETYISHKHQNMAESVRFLKQEQQILQTQAQEEAKTTSLLRQEYERLRRQLSEVKTINDLIRRRYILRESIRIDTQQSYNDRK